jgi:hypothetical protein
MDIVEQIKQHNLIEDLVREGGYKLPKRNTRYLKAEHSNGLVVDTKNQTYHWNGRNEFGDVIQWVMNQHGCDFKNACEILCRRAGLPEPKWKGEDHQARIAARRKEDALNVAARVFHAWFWKSNEAQAYIAGRGLTLTRDSDEDATIYSAGTAERAMLGYSGSGSQAERDEMINALRDAGVDVTSPVAVSVLGFKGDVRKWCKDHNIEPGEMDERWVNGRYIPGMVGSQRIVFPYKVYGRVVYMAGRSILDKRHYNLPGMLVGGRPEMYLSHAYTMKADHVVIVEGQMDAETWAQWGVASVSMSGAKLNEEVIQILKQNHKHMYLVTDVDVTGLIRTWSNAEMLGPLTRIMFPRDLSGYQIPILPTDEESKRKSKELANQIIMAMNKGKDFPIPKSDGTFANKDLKPGDEGYREVNDSNDLLQAMSGSTVKTSVQEAYAAQMLSKSPTFAELAAAWAGAREGAARSEAIKFAIGVISHMGEMEFQDYRTRLYKALGLNGVRELTAMLKTYANQEEKEKSEGEPEYTWGGYIEGWLIEYLYDKENDYAQLAWRSPEGVIDSGRSVVINGKRYEPAPPDTSLKMEAVLFPSKLGEKKELRELILLVEMFIKSVYILPEGQTARLMAYYVLTTWIYDCFSAVMYLRATGPAGAGKSELMRRVGLVCYKTMSANGSSTSASLFRMVERFRGTVFIDEADIQQSDESNDLVKFMNLGAMDGNPIWRTVEETGPDGKKTWAPVPYRTFCPKLIAMRQEFKDDAVATRSMTFKTQPKTMAELKAAKVPLGITHEMRERSLVLRNILLRWRLEIWQPQREVNFDWYEMSISARLNQVAGSLLAIAEEDQEQQEEIRKNLREYYAETVLNKSMSLTARVIEAMWKIYQDPELFKEMVKAEPDGTELIKVGDITRIAGEIMDEMNDVYEGEEENQKNIQKLKPQKVGHILRQEMQLRISERRRDGFWCYWNKPRMMGLSMQFGIDPNNFTPLPGSNKPNQPTQGGLL